MNARLIAKMLTLVMGGCAMFHPSWAACKLPWPDTYRPGVSRPNVVGKIVALSDSQITLQTRSVRLHIGLPKSDVYYTAFGGDDHINNLKLGLIARAWYINCTASKANRTPPVAYLEVYSNDPDDRPPPSYWTRY